ncbi:NYN domain-containing protein [Frankia sp. CNm7]|uniref:NYN domain-containing protein n=1 Tax=Frankia nepalensis TaxID=1836974 RepID=UPI0019313B9D|nr:NYN domain-containing protein [Frankia nepalensis]MBL7520425.1 NYN domain-containing protein [Frankia nepalensis]
MLVDGWNHYLAAMRCFGYKMAVQFPIDRLAASLTTQTKAEAVIDVAVVMALPNRHDPAEQPEFWTWRSRLNRLHNYGVRHEKARFRYESLKCSACEHELARVVECERCATPHPLAGRRKEKGADIKIAALALDGAWLASYSTLILLSQDSDFGPLVQQLKEVHRRQDRWYDLYSAYPVCSQAGHEHRSVPGTKPLEITEEDYAMLASRPLRDPRAAG